MNLIANMYSQEVIKMEASEQLNKDTSLTSWSQRHLTAEESSRVVTSWLSTTEGWRYWDSGMVRARPVPVAVLGRGKMILVMKPRPFLLTVAR